MLLNIILIFQSNSSHWSVYIGYVLIQLIFWLQCRYCFFTTLCFLCMMGGRVIIINVNALISGHTGGYYMGISQDLSTLFINLKSAFSLQDRRGAPGGFLVLAPFCRWSWKRVPFLSAKGLGTLNW